MKKYSTPTAEIVKFDAEDIMTTSSVGGGTLTSEAVGTVGGDPIFMGLSNAFNE